MLSTRRADFAFSMNLGCHLHNISMCLVLRHSASDWFLWTLRQSRSSDQARVFALLSGSLLCQGRTLHPLSVHRCVHALSRCVTDVRRGRERYVSHGSSFRNRTLPRFLGVFKGTSDIALLIESESVSDAVLRSAGAHILAHHGWHELYVCQFLLRQIWRRTDRDSCQNHCPWQRHPCRR